MPGYIEKYLHKFQHYSPLRKHNSLHQWIRPQYVSRIQYAPNDDTTSELDKDEKTKVQNIVVTLLYYAWYLDCIIITELNIIAEQQSKPTELIDDAITQLIDYVATHTNSIVRYKSSDMLLHVGTCMVLWG